MGALAAWPSWTVTIDCGGIPRSIHIRKGKLLQTPESVRRHFEELQKLGKLTQGKITSITRDTAQGTPPQFGMSITSRLVASGASIEE